jgi:hypothetical protein
MVNGCSIKPSFMAGVVFFGKDGYPQTQLENEE